MNLSIVLAVVVVLVGGVLGVVGLFRPFFGLLVFILIHFIQPGELIPELAPLRIELVYGSLLIAIVVFRQLSRKGFSFLRYKIFFAACLLVTAGVLSVPFSVWPGGAAGTVVKMLQHVTLIFLLMSLINTKSRLRQMLWCISVVAVWFACSSLFAFARGDYYALGDLDRAKGLNSIIGGPNELAGLLLALLPMLIALLRTTRSIVLRIVLVVFGSISLFAIILTGSRIALIGLIAIALFYTLQSRHKVLTLTASLLIGVLTWGLLPTEYKARYLSVEHYATGGQLDASNRLRLEIWKTGGKIFLEHPIFGAGAGQFSTAYGMRFLAQGEHRAWMNPHNLMIQVACELGIVGLAVFSYFIWQIALGIRFVLRKKRRRTRDLNYQMAIACSVMYMGTMILSLVGHTLYRPYWYLLAGFVAANRNIVVNWLKSRKHEESEDDTGSEKRASVADGLTTFPGVVSAGS